MTEQELGLVGLSDSTKVVITQECADELGVPRSTTVGCIRKALAGKADPQKEFDFMSPTQDSAE